MTKQKHIVVLGGGFAGMTVISQLAKHIHYGGHKKVKVTLVDRRDYHLYHPNLYEVATAEEELAGMSALKKSVALHFKKILPKGTDFVKGEAKDIDTKSKTLIVETENGNQTLSYDYLILGLGSVSDDFGIPGIKEHALTLTSVNDALKIRNAIGFLIQSRRMDVNKQTIRIILGGGGFTGVELASELVNLIDLLSWKNNYPREKIELMIIEGGSQLMQGMAPVVSSTVYHRLKAFGVNIILGQIITGVEKNKVTLKNGEVLRYDLFIWAGGVKSATMPLKEKIQTDRKGRAMTAPDLSVQSMESIYAIGDNACVMDESGRPMPPTATQAIMHAEYVAAAIASRMKGRVIPNYVCKANPFIIPVKGKWAMFRTPNGFTMQGFIPWLLKSGASIRYFSRFMSLFKAMKLVWFEEDIYTRND